MNRMDSRPVEFPPQHRAADPSISAWVAANAGSGKTHVLVNRAIRLMLAGTHPQRILCLTYTVAAATEMAGRLFEKLGGWIALDEVDLRNAIGELVGEGASAVELTLARRLFARALDTPGGLKIQTIHAFCEQLLQRFPVEAGVVPGFRVLEERRALELIAEAREAVLVAGDGAPDTLLGIIAHAGEERFDALVGELIRTRPALLDVAGADLRRRLLRHAMRTAGDAALADIERDVVASIDRRAYSHASRCLREYGKRAGELAGAVDACLLSRSPADAFRSLKEAFLTEKGEPRSPAYMIPAKLRLDHPSSALFLESEQERLLPFFDRHDAARIVEMTDSLCDIGGRIVRQYDRRKQAAGSYDYDDLIARTLRMMSSVDSGWVLYKLDGGIDHVLVDEAQDTSIDQWTIVKALSAEFFAGRGARSDAARTIFAVGDEKQSIFGFQGASPQSFREIGHQFETLGSEAQCAFEHVELNVSFRSAQAVLDMVDAVFPGGSHYARRRGVAGLVELWPLEAMEDAEDRDPWRAPDRYALRERPRRRLAARIARAIRGWIDRGEILHSEGRPIRPSDILILVRNRTTLMDEIVRSLKTAGLPVAGADRLALTTHFAVMDLMALGRALLLPQDDQMLACALKSALLARDDGAPIDDDDLFSLCSGRGPTSLWERLADAVASGAPFRKALHLMRAWREDALSRPPYEFYMTVLGTDGVYAALLARLGSEADEPVDAFLSQCLDYDQSHSPSLERFLQWLDGEQAMIKRDMDMGAGEIRVMTVHGAKGLESNIVILPDTCALPDRAKDPSILTCEAEVDGRRFEVPLWRVREGRDHPVVKALREELREDAMEEYGRLLYVAMTRARDRLYVCGFPDRAGTRDAVAECWFSRIENALKQHGRSLLDDDGQTIWRYENASDVGAALAPDEAPDMVDETVHSPAWLHRPAPVEPRVTLSRSAARLAAPSVAERISSPMSEDDPRRFRRGILIHRLLQMLPDLDAGAREPAARRFLSQPGYKLAEAERDDILQAVLRLIDDPRFAMVFGEGSLAEVPFAAEIDGVSVSGRVDRMVVTKSEVLILDYKTNRPPPATIEDADPSYLRQLAIYRRALGRIFPDCNIRAALLWTEAPRLMEIPAGMIDGDDPSEEQMVLPLTV